MEGVQCSFFQSVCGQVCVDTGPVAYFLRHDGGDAGIGRVERLIDCHRFCPHMVTEVSISQGYQPFFSILRAEAQRVLLVLCLRDKIVPTGQYFPDGADHAGNVFDAVDDHIFLVAEDDIAVLAHHFDDQLLAAQVAQFV